MTANIRAWGNSQGIYIPKKLLNELGLNVNDRVSLSIEGDRLVIRKDESVSEKEKAWVSLQAIRNSLSGKAAAPEDYRIERNAYLDEKYGK